MTIVRLLPATDNNGQMTVVYVDNGDNIFWQTGFNNTLNDNLFVKQHYRWQ